MSIVLSTIAHFRGEIPSAFGYTLCRVSSGSMEPELQVGDVILGKKVSEPEKLKVGDVITFKGEDGLEGMFITHKIIVAPHEEEGVLMLQTKGTANEIPDSPISGDRVVSVMLGEVWFLNKFYSFFLSPWGLITIVFLIIIIFIDELIALVRNLSGNTKPAKKVDINDIISQIKNDSQTDEDNNADV